MYIILHHVKHIKMLASNNLVQYADSDQFGTDQVWKDQDQ